MWEMQALCLIAVTRIVVLVSSEVGPFRGICRRSGLFNKAQTDYSLTGHVIEDVHAFSVIDCSAKCVQNPRCMSINYKQGSNNLNQCELNNSTKTKSPADFVSRQGYQYYDTNDQEQTSVPCSSNPCHHSKKCVYVCGERSEKESYYCRDCPSCYTGVHCEKWSRKGPHLDFKTANSTNKAIATTTTTSTSMKAATVCLWVRSTGDQEQGRIFNYNDQFSLWGHVKLSYFGFYVSSAPNSSDQWVGYKKISGIGGSHLWHSLCASWENVKGRWSIYTDGKMRSNDVGYCIGCEVSGSKTMEIVGSDSYPFDGQITQVNMWDSELTAEQISSYLVSPSNTTPVGNVLQWRDFESGLQGPSLTAVCDSEYQSAEDVFDYMINFPTNSVSNFILIDGLASRLSSLSLCLWVRTSHTCSSVFSHAVSSYYNNELLFIWAEGLVHFNVHNKVGRVSMWVEDEIWHHVCITWSNAGGQVKLYIDGIFLDSVNNIANGVTTLTGGKVVIGQDQDAVGGSFDVNQAFKGQISRMNLWNYVLTDQAIAAASRGNDNALGNILSWVDVMKGQIHGDVTLVKGAGIEPQGPEVDFDLIYGTQSTNNRLTKSNPFEAAEVIHVAACVWIKTSAAKFAVFSYSTTNQINMFAWTLESGVSSTLYIHGASVSHSSTSFNNNYWQFLCMRWGASHGDFYTFSDGKQHALTANFNAGKTILGGGKLTIGQLMTSYASFDGSYSFSGSMTGLNIWDNHRVITSLPSFAKGCSTVQGSLVAWSTLRGFTKHGDVSMTSSSSCLLPDALTLERRTAWCKDYLKKDYLRARFGKDKGNPGKLWRCYYNACLTDDESDISETRLQLTECNYHSLDSNLVNIIQKA